MLKQRRLYVLVLAVMVASGIVSLRSEQPQPSWLVKKHGVTLDIRSRGRVIRDTVAASGGRIPAAASTPVPGVPPAPQVQLRGGNVQANDPAFDNIQTFPLHRPFVNFNQAETSLAAFGRNIVATYNSLANVSIVLDPSPPPAGSVLLASAFVAGFSTSNDGGATWTTGFMPPLPGVAFTFGDPSIDVDRHGNFYFSNLGVDAVFNSTVQVNKSTDGGRTWSPAVLVQLDNGADKDWIAVGRDPFDKSRDNVYVTWTSFQPTGAELRLSRSTDGGTTWVTRSIFAPPPDPNPTHPQNFLQFSTPYVDPVTGRLYVPFLNFSLGDQDFIRILISDDAGETFHFATFNFPGAPDPTLLPVTTAGELIDCGTNPDGAGGGFTVVIRDPSSQYSDGRFGLHRFSRVTRLITQPAFAARNGILYLAWSNSTSTFFGDPSSQSNVMFMRSDDGGSSWTAPIQANPAVLTDVHHVLPALAIDTDPNDVHISFYTQHADGTIDVDMANSHDRGATFPAKRTLRITPASETLAPTNNLLSGTDTTNYDRLFPACYSLGEYTSVKSANGTQYLIWGDVRNTVTQPVNALDPISGQTHSQEDVFFQKVKAQ